MSFCPECRLEYRPGFTLCPDCNRELVDERPPEPKPSPPADSRPNEEWIAVAQLTSQVYAAMVEEGLREQNVPVAVLSGAGYFGLLGQMGISSFRPVGGAYVILVPRVHVARADAEGEAMLGDVWRQSRLVDTGDQTPD